MSFTAKRPFASLETKIPALPEKKPKTESLTFYLLDVYDDCKTPGSVALFGRVEDSNESCCIVVEKVRPRHHLRIKPGYTANDVTEEIRRRSGAKFHADVVSKKVVSGDKLPQSEELVEVTVEDSRAMIPAEGVAFVKISSTDASSDQLLRECGVQGPGFLKVVGAEELVAQPTSHCRRSFRLLVPCGQRATLEPVLTTKTAPIFSAMALNFVTVSTAQKEEEIVILTMAKYDNVALDAAVQATPSSITTFFTPPSTGVISQRDRGEMQELRERYPGRQISSEKELLRLVLARLKHTDVDILLGHNMARQMELLSKRIRKHNLDGWSQLGRLNQRGVVPTADGATTERLRLTAGRPVIDSLSLASELLRLPSYELKTILVELGNGLRVETLTAQDTAAPYYFENAKYSLASIVLWSRSSLEGAVEVIRRLDGLSFYACMTRRVCGSLSRVIMTGSAYRVETMVFNALHRSDFIFATYPQGQIANASYTGGLVLDPCVGLHQGFTMLLDFQSLYPSIIIEHNICWTTIANARASDSTSVQLPEAGTAEGVIPALCRSLCESRRSLKEAMSRRVRLSAEHTKLETQQQALKILTNSIYGTLGARFSPLYARNLAALIASLGRQLLLDTKQRVETRGHQVYLGDTVSLFVSTLGATTPAEAWKEGRELASEINHTRGCLRIELETIFSRLLILRKKSYAGLSVDSKGERRVVIRGADVVQRTIPPILKELGRDILDVILTTDGDCAAKILSRLRRFRGLVISGKRPLEDFQIMKMLAKDPCAYSTDSVPHADVAKRRNAESNGRYRKGDVVPYLVCMPREGSSVHLQPDEALSNGAVLDRDYYLSKLVIPTALRLCARVPGVDKEAVASALGVALATTPKRPSATHRAYRFECPQCKKANVIHKMSVSKLDGEWLSLAHCSHCGVDLHTQCDELLSALNTTMDGLERRFQESTFGCDDPQCHYTTDSVDASSWAEHDLNSCPACVNGVLRREYSARRHYEDLTHLKALVDVGAWLYGDERTLAKDLLNENMGNAAIRPVYEALLIAVEARLNALPYNRVNLSVLLSGLH